MKPSDTEQQQAPACVLIALDATLQAACTPRVMARLADARRAALGRSQRHAPAIAAHWFDWTPSAAVIALAAVISWDSAGLLPGSIDDDLLADSMPVYALIDPELEDSLTRSGDWLFGP